MTGRIRGAFIAALAVSAIVAPAAPGLAQTGGVGAGATASRPHADRAFMIGRWTDTGDCEDSVELAADGHFTAANGGEGDWRMDGELLTLAGDSTLTAFIVAVDRDTIAVVNADGTMGRSTRCDDDQYDPNFVAIGIA